MDEGERGRGGKTQRRYEAVRGEDRTTWKRVKGRKALWDPLLKSPKYKWGFSVIDLHVFN